ncbi:hypothetical protein DFS34DRAFT_590053 [Phlyctochytrium arcticum]|nr:hypothetical protein DFS34DRAFT_590053 [Phlyctochytrium arcticum]
MTRDRVDSGDRGLPNELLLRVFSYLSSEDLLPVVLACRSYRAAALTSIADRLYNNEKGFVRKKSFLVLWPSLERSEIRQYFSLRCEPSIQVHDRIHTPVAPWSSQRGKWRLGPISDDGFGFGNGGIRPARIAGILKGYDVPTTGTTSSLGGAYIGAVYSHQDVCFLFQVCPNQNQTPFRTKGVATRFNLPAVSAGRHTVFSDDGAVEITLNIIPTNFTMALAVIVEEVWVTCGYLLGATTARSGKEPAEYGLEPVVKRYRPASLIAADTVPWHPSQAANATWWTL